MPNGMDVVHRLRACAPQARHVVVSADNQPSTALEAIDAAAFSTMTAALQVVVAQDRGLCMDT